MNQAISIDNVLDAYSGDENIEICGKLGIARSILEAERSSLIYCNTAEQKKINFSNIPNTWFAGFIKILTENVHLSDIESIFDNVVILNFNYDRCIEHYLHQSLQNYYNISIEEASTLMKKIKIFHPYGSVGKLPWQADSDIQVPYGCDRSSILNISKQIKTFSEKVTEIAEMEKMHQTIQDAEIIVFLGFAFHRQNLQLLCPPVESKVKRIYATALGISNSDCNVIRADLNRIFKPITSDVMIEFRNDLQCIGLFNEYWRSLTAGI